MTQPALALEARDISKTYATARAEEGLSFEVNKGEIFGLLGPNGAGKTTSIRKILDIIKPDAGQISVLGGTMIEAPSKEMIIFEHSGQRPLFEEPAAFADVVKRVLDDHDVSTAHRPDLLSWQGSLGCPAVVEPCR